LVKSPTKPSVVVPKDIEKDMVNRELGKQSDFKELMGLEDAKRYAQFRDKVVVGMDRDVRFAASQMDTNSFMNSILPIKLK